MLSSFGVNDSNKNINILSEYISYKLICKDQVEKKPPKNRKCSYNSQQNNIKSVCISFKCFVSLHLTNIWVYLTWNDGNRPSQHSFPEIEQKRMSSSKSIPIWLERSMIITYWFKNCLE